ncbi:efflux RND transporter periplasmic adaptor subunit [Chitinophaga agrisoli]|uniref:Efflux RND transporter periplasmic adaptor subunit n=1 Tax=Chitinophaga agrisoli TaxID=2607653 RepID=A0A5B2VLR1_9BACT|nr:efflux RND transporter periplasmic adaptor subunit [Chitinophaga agrisoli]KAA2239262.1 efflux RND transporter periplasmic adaptor subunit [Chitinophaga agrisoli]
MKRNYIVNISAVLLLSACGQGPQPAAHDHQHMQAEKPDTSLAPLLQPVNEQVLSQVGAVQPEKAHSIVLKEIKGTVVYDTRSETGIASRVSGRIEKLYIKYNYQPVKKGQLIMQVYAPDLVAAQRELLFIQAANDNPSLLEGAKQRLLLMGMNAQQLAQVMQTRQPLYRVNVYSNASGYIIDKAAQPAPASVTAAPPVGDNMGMGAATPATAAAPVANTPVLLREGQYVNAGENLFTIYKADKLVGEFALEPVTASYISKGQSLVLQSASGNGDGITGTVGLIQPVFRNGENFTLVRVYLQGQPFNAGTLLTARIPITVSGGWWLPAAAVLQLGSRSVIFKQEGTVYRPVPVTTGLREKGQVQVLDSIAGWNIARNAYFLVDSESFIKVKE